MPDSPPITNIATNATALSMGTWKRMLPRHIVPIQLNTFTAEGTAITSVDTMKDDPRVGVMPLTTMGWPQRARQSQDALRLPIRGGRDRRAGVPCQERGRERCDCGRA